MAFQVAVEELGDGVEEATFSEWLKAVGDDVEAGEPLAEVMTDKVNLEIDAPVAGVLRSRLVQPEEVVRVGQVIAEIEVSR
jgi:pyruvate/2-oxoglutarate dehydrogenase complex dihydrolipoamide acyltransferase (E2) component